MHRPYQAAADIAVLPSQFPIPGLGFLAVNAYVIKAEEPVLVDTGMGMDSEEFVEALASVIDPADIRWVFITHDDADHVGSIRKVLEAAPDARLVTNAVTALRMSTAWPVPMERLYCLNPEESISVGDRELTAFRPPVFDNPATLGFYDTKSNAVFSADFFGAVLPSRALDLSEVSEEALTEGMVLWATIDAPWIHFVDQTQYLQNLNVVSKMAPKMIFSSHLPPAQGKTEQFLRSLAIAPHAEPFVAPNQAILQQIMAAGV
jgi:flavorubredoxin